MSMRYKSSRVVVVIVETVYCVSNVERESRWGWGGLVGLLPAQSAHCGSGVVPLRIFRNGTSQSRCVVSSNISCVVTETSFKIAQGVSCVANNLTWDGA